MSRILRLRVRRGTVLFPLLLGTALFLILIWGLGWMTSYTFGGSIHVLLIAGLALAAVWIFLPIGKNAGEK
jgi:hypothetical protein